MLLSIGTTAWPIASPRRLIRTDTRAALTLGKGAPDAVDGVMDSTT